MDTESIKQEELIIDSIETFVAITTRLTSMIKGPVWFRGQSDASWDLRPAVMRSNKMAGHEPNRCIHFMNRAQIRHNSCPAVGDLPGWLFLMQHYGLHTRLLDWTEAPLVALFFAIENLHSEQSAVYVLDPNKLNEIQGYTAGILLPHHAKAKELIDPAFKTAEPISAVAAILPPEVDYRMLLQKSVFTVHGDSTPLDSHTESKNFLAKMIIPKQHADRINQQLKALGINRAYLFPDLANLAKTLNEGTGGAR